MPLIRVCLSPFLGGMLLLAAALNLYLFVVSLAAVQLVLVALFGLGGYLYVARPYLIVDDHLVQTRSRLGIPTKTLHFASPHDLQIDGRVLWVRTPMGREKISGTAANARHWRALGEAIAKAQAEAPRASAGA